MDSKKHILTKKEVAERYGVSVTTVDTWCSRSPQSLPRFFKLGNAANSPIRFRLEDCIAFEEAQLAKQDELTSEMDSNF